MKFSIFRSELKVTIIIFIAGVCWIIFTDKLLEQIAGGRWNDNFKYGEIFKGILFVTLMSIALFLLLRNHDKKLRANLNSLMGLFQDNPNAMWIYDAKTLQFLAVNDAAIAKYGYSREEFLQKRINEIFISQENNNQFNTISDNPLFFDSGIWQLKKKDNSTLFVRQLSHSITFNNVACNLTLTEDLTNVITQGKKLRNIAFKNSHELRKPVANIMGLIQVLDKENLTKENFEIIQYIETSTRELDNIIKSIAEESTEE